MNPAKVIRSKVEKLTDLPNIGKALVGRNPYELYEQLCAITGVRQDPCVLDVFISITRFMDGDDPLPWWAYTAERKRTPK